MRGVIGSSELDEKLSCGKDFTKKSVRTDVAGGGAYCKDIHNKESLDALGQWSQGDELHKWRAFFLQMDGVLCAEGARLENWLNEITKMQSHCTSDNKSIQKFDTADCFIGVRNENHEKGIWTWSSNKMEKNLALGASAASIFSTANFAAAMEIQS